jgi:hypothetical protein
MLVDTGSSQEYSFNGGRYDLFSARIPGATTRWLHPKEHGTPPSLGRAIREPHLSPDGRFVAFYANRADLPPDERLAIGWYQNPHVHLGIWLKDLERGTVSQLTRGENGWYKVAWSPGGELLCATYLTRLQAADPTTPCDLFVLGARARTRLRVATLPDQPFALNWTRNGRSILIQTRDGLYAVSRWGGKLTRLVSAPVFRSDVALSPDGRQAAYVEGDRLRLVSTTPGAAGRIAALREPPGTPREVEEWCAVVWSRDGRRVAAAVVSRDNYLSTTRTVFHVVDAASGADRTIGAMDGETATDQTPSLWWSRNGQWLIVRYFPVMSHAVDALATVQVSSGRLVVLSAPKRPTHGMGWLEREPGR